MKTKPISLFIATGTLAAGLLVDVALAGPSLPVTKPPVTPVGLLTGPPVDPAATNGQWFSTPLGMMSSRPYEFYDNPAGGPAGINAISGYVSSITFLAGPGSPILAFSIQATLQNDNVLVSSWNAGTNSHGEGLSGFFANYVGSLVDAQLTAEFAIADTNSLPPTFRGPYRQTNPFIVATNEDQSAWYCWNPDDPDPGHAPHGGFWVPTWNFGTVPLGQTASRQLDFVVPPPGLSPLDPRYTAIVSSYTTSNDILMNRSESLKISTWIDDIALDAGQGSPPPYHLSSVSVFHLPESGGPLLDFGDAPDPLYPTLLINDGARHILDPGVFMGALIDAETDGRPNLNATGDDLDNLADEDGVMFLTPLVVGQTATVQVTVSRSGYINAWIDFDSNGSWGDPGEQVLVRQYVPGAGSHLFPIPVPASAATNDTFARFRFTTSSGSLSYTGLANDGEVEDHAVRIRPDEKPLHDFGDADDSNFLSRYPTLLINNGARHIVNPSVYLGVTIDAEPDGWASPTADGDDLNPPGATDDEDGVFLPPELVAGSTAQVFVVASAPGFLNAWIDWNGNSRWSDPDEHVFVNQPLSHGVNVLNLPVPRPPTLVAGGPHSRWRFTSYAPMIPSFLGIETDGEVEDYEVRLEVYDFGDAPDSYRTSLTNDGARHRIPSPYHLGMIVPDLDPDGQITADASGDDMTGADDEDGVFVPNSLVRGMPGLLLIHASANGFLQAWLDFNNDGDWNDPGEQIAADHWLMAGINTLNFSIPPDSTIGPVLGRFRFSSSTGLNSFGFAGDGEVEDHSFIIYQTGPTNPVGFAITNILVETTNNSFTLEWEGEPNVIYETQYLLDLLDTVTPWAVWGPWISAPPFRQTDTNAAGTTKFYRVIAPYSPPPP